MEENRDGHAIVSNVIKSLESGDSFSPRDRVKFAQTARGYGIEGSVIEEVIVLLSPLVLSTAMKIGLMQAIWQERRRKPCALNSKKALMKI